MGNFAENIEVIGGITVLFIGIICGLINRIVNIKKDGLFVNLPGILILGGGLLFLIIIVIYSLF